MADLRCRGNDARRYLARAIADDFRREALSFAWRYSWTPTTATASYAPVRRTAMDSPEPAKSPESGTSGRGTSSADIDLVLLVLAVGTSLQTSIVMAI